VSGSLHVLEILGRGGTGPMERWVHALARALLAGGARVSAVCPEEGAAHEALAALGCSVMVAAVGDDPSFASVRDVASLVVHEGVGVVHAHYANGHVLGALVAAVTAQPSLATLHGASVGMRDLEAHRLVRHGHLHARDPAAAQHARSIGVAPGRIHLVADAAGDEGRVALCHLLSRLARRERAHATPAMPALAGAQRPGTPASQTA
jgi:hypothetical protein